MLPNSMLGCVQIALDPEAINVAPLYKKRHPLIGDTHSIERAVTGHWPRFVSI
jgi:hypothetical protein